MIAPMLMVRPVNFGKRRSGYEEWASVGGRFLGAEARSAQDGLIPSRFERDGGVFAALGAYNRCFCNGAAAIGEMVLSLTGLAAFGVVVEVLESEECLLVGGEDKTVTAVDTAQDAIDKIHSAPGVW